AQKYPPEAKKDLLVINGPEKDPAYFAFVRAVRGLPQQHQEAFLLHYGQKMDARGMAVTMDCSTEAAANHLNAARQAIGQLVGGAAMEELAGKLALAYGRLEPSSAIVTPAVRKAVGRFLWPRRIKRLVVWLAVLVILGGVAWIAWKISGR